MSRFAVLVAAALLLGCCSGQVLRQGHCPHVSPMPHVDLNKYMGVWFEQMHSRRWTGLELKCSMEYFELSHPNAFNVNSFTYSHVQALQTLCRANRTFHIRGVATLEGEKGAEGKLAIQIPDLKIDGVVKLLGTDYKSYTVLWSCMDAGRMHFENVVVMTRSPEPSNEAITPAMGVLIKNHIPRTYMQYTSHRGCPNIDPIQLSKEMQKSHNKKPPPKESLEIKSPTKGLPPKKTPLEKPHENEHVKESHEKKPNEKESPESKPHAKESPTKEPHQTESHKEPHAKESHVNELPPVNKAHTKEPSEKQSLVKEPRENEHHAKESPVNEPLVNAPHVNEPHLKVPSSGEPHTKAPPRQEKPPESHKEEQKKSTEAVMAQNPEKKKEIQHEKKLDKSNKLEPEKKSEPRGVTIKINKNEPKVPPPIIVHSDSMSTRKEGRADSKKPTGKTETAAEADPREPEGEVPSAMKLVTSVTRVRGAAGESSFLEDAPGEIGTIISIVPPVTSIQAPGK